MEFGGTLFSDKPIHPPHQAEHLKNISAGKEQTKPKMATKNTTTATMASKWGGCKVGTAESQPWEVGGQASNLQFGIAKLVQITNVIQVFCNMKWT